MPEPSLSQSLSWESILRDLCPLDMRDVDTESSLCLYTTLSPAGIIPVCVIVFSPNHHGPLCAAIVHLLFFLKRLGNHCGTSDASHGTVMQRDGMELGEHQELCVGVCPT